MSCFDRNQIVYTRDSGIKKLYELTTDDYLLDNRGNFCKIKHISTDTDNEFNPVEIHIFKTEPIITTTHQRFLTVKNIDDTPLWKTVEQLNITDYVAMTTIRLNTDVNDDDDSDEEFLKEIRFLLMGICVTCSKIEDDCLKITVMNKRKTLYYCPFFEHGVDKMSSDKDLVIEIVNRLFSVKPKSVVVSNKDKRKSICKITYELNKEISDFVGSIIDTIKKPTNSYSDIHNFILGMHHNFVYTKTRVFVIFKDIEKASLVRSILRNFGVDVNFSSVNSLYFNNIFAVNMDIYDGNDPCGNPTNNVIQCIFSGNHWYKSKYTFLKVMSINNMNTVPDMIKLDTEGDGYNVCNILTKNYRT